MSAPLRAFKLLLISVNAIVMAVGALFPSYSAAETLVNGGSIDGAISIPREEDTHSYFANAGDNVQITVTDTSGGPFSPYVRFYGPTGALLGASQGQTVAGNVYLQAALTGTYTVVVKDLDFNGAPGDRTGTYRIDYVRAPGANEHGSLVNGGSRTETIGVGDIDSFTYFASAGDKVQITVTDTSGGPFVPYVRFYGPTGAVVGSSQGQTVAGNVYLQAEVTGIYTVVVKDSDFNGAPGDRTGTYRIDFVRAPGANEHGSLVNGGSRTETIGVGDIDSFTYFANAGDSAQITVTDTSGGPFVSYVRFYGPTGALLGSSQGQPVTGPINLPAATTGIYSVVVKDIDFNGAPGDRSGNYKIDFVLTSSLTRLSYAALGDSYSAGEGLPPYFEPE